MRPSYSRCTQECILHQIILKIEFEENITGYRTRIHCQHIYFQVTQCLKIRFKATGMHVKLDSKDRQGAITHRTSIQIGQAMSWAGTLHKQRIVVSRIVKRCFSRNIG